LLGLAVLVNVMVIDGVLVAVIFGVLVGVLPGSRSFTLSICRSMAPFALLAHCKAMISFKVRVPGPP
jgi:TctA family transporter